MNADLTNTQGRNHERDELLKQLLDARTRMYYLFASQTINSATHDHMVAARESLEVAIANLAEIRF
jgi:hypothetical protein